MKKIICALALTLSPVAVFAAGPATINLFAGNSQPVSASFTENDNGKTSTGVLVLGKNGQARWERKTPYEEIVVSNGKTAWQIDYGLKQAVRLPATTAQELSLVLNGQGQKSRLYQVKQEKDSLVLTPRQNQNADVPAMRIALDKKGYPTQIAFLGTKKHTISFTGWSRAPKTQFEYIPEKGMDVLGQ